MNQKLTFPDSDLMLALCGEHNAHLRLLEEKTGVKAGVRGNEVFLEGGTGSWIWPNGC